MKLKDKVKPKLPPVAPGVYMAVCVGVVDIGEQYDQFQKNYKYRMMFVWALPGELVEIDGEMCERQLSKEFTQTYDKRGALKPFLESWNVTTYTEEELAEIELFEQIGKACQLQVSLNEAGTYAKVTNLMPLPKGMPVPESKTATFTWDMDKWNDALFDSLPEWIQNKIKKSTQYQKLHAPETVIEVKDAPAAEGNECPI